MNYVKFTFQFISMTRQFLVFTHVTILHDNRCYPPCWSTTKLKQTPQGLLFCLDIAQKHRYFHHGLMFNGELSL